MQTLLAVDCGLKTGLALYNQKACLLWYRSHHFASAEGLKRHTFKMLKEIPDLSMIVLEGGGRLAYIWQREAQKMDILYREISANQWRKRLLLPREQANGRTAKKAAHELARKVIDWSRAKKPTSLQDHAAEAILIGLYGLWEVGWLADIPKGLR